MMQVKKVFAELPTLPARPLPRAGLPGLVLSRPLSNTTALTEPLGTHQWVYGWALCRYPALFLSLPNEHYHLLHTIQDKVHKRCILITFPAGRTKKTTGEIVICQDTSMLDPLHRNACCQAPWKSNKHPSSDSPSLRKSILLTSRVRNKNQREGQTEVKALKGRMTHCWALGNR